VEISRNTVDDGLGWSPSCSINLNSDLKELCAHLVAKGVAIAFLRNQKTGCSTGADGYKLLGVQYKKGLINYQG